MEEQLVSVIVPAYNTERYNIGYVVLSGKPDL